MAQASTMGPPLSPRETRRSGRRSLPSASTSASKSPDSDSPPKQKEIQFRPPLTSNNSSGKQKRLKQEEQDEPTDESKSEPLLSTNPTNSAHIITGRTKRKTKDKDKQPVVEVNSSGDVPDSAEHLLPNAPEEEEQGITRCVCGSTGEDDPDAGEFMVQCETCKVWQHGLCMGFESEDQLHDDDYYCEECKPELHTDLFKRRSKKPRQSSTTSHHNPTSASSRISRSHSPSTLLKQPSKRRNTMNSRDAAFDESLKEIIEATAAEAAAAHEAVNVTSTRNQDSNQVLGNDLDPEPSGRKKRKHNEDDAPTQKRARSASTASDHQGSAISRNDVAKGAVHTPAQPSRPSGRANKRGGRKSAVAALPLDTPGPIDSEDALLQASTKRPGSNNRAKASNAPKRPPASHSASHSAANTAHEHGTRRNQTSGLTGQAAGSNPSESSRAYRNSHAYAVSQQPLYTSWNLPDYLAHLEPMLPTDAPQPLEVRSGGTGTTAGGESSDHTVERGVKVKWPSKRMSVGDMNKRVRSLVEWVGREQATALDRMRRRGALNNAFQEELRKRERPEKGAGISDPVMIVDGPEVESPDTPVQDAEKARKSITVPTHELNDLQSSATMKMMEELMEELIGFQERFGPGVRARERRLVST